MQQCKKWLLRFFACEREPIDGFPHCPCIAYASNAPIPHFLLAQTSHVCILRMLLSWLPIVLPWRFWSNMCEIARWRRRWWHEKWSDVPMEAHSRSNVSYHSSRSEVLPRMSHSSHGDGQRFTALDIGRRTQRGIEIAARCCTWSSDASPFYGPFDISACRACRRRARRAVARKIIILAHLVQIARSLGMLLLLACCLGRSKPGAAPHAIARFPIFHAHPFIACYSSNFGPLHNAGEEKAHSMKECRRFDTASRRGP